MRRDNAGGDGEYLHKSPAASGYHHILPAHFSPQSRPAREGHSHTKEHRMRIVRLLRDYSTCRFLKPLITFSIFAGAPAQAEEPLSSVIADGKPWEMVVVKRRASNILVFRPDGGGTISDSLVSISPTWRAAPGGICIRPRPGDAEKCLQLTRTKAGIEASQSGKTVWVLKR